MPGGCEHERGDERPKRILVRDMQEGGGSDENPADIQGATDIDHDVVEVQAWKEEHRFN